MNYEAIPGNRAEIVDAIMLNAAVHGYKLPDEGDEPYREMVRVLASQGLIEPLGGRVHENNSAYQRYIATSMGRTAVDRAIRSGMKLETILAPQRRLRIV